MEFQPPQNKFFSQVEKQADTSEETDNPGSEKRMDYITWEDYFMALALLTAKRSKDPVTQVGAVIIDHMNRIVGMGYNGFPRGISDDEFSWGKNKNSLSNKKFYVCHAEVNAVLNKNCASTRDCRLFVTEFPCSGCAKILVQSEIKEVIYANDKKSATFEVQASKKMLNAAGIKYRLFKPVQKQILIDFSLVGKLL